MIGEILSRYWWMTVLRGLFWIVFGIVLLASPGISLLTLTLAFGIVMLADGIVNVAHAFSGRRVHEDWWVLLLVGLTGIVVGALTLYSPQATAIALVFYVAIWAVATGVLQITAAIRLRKQLAGEVWLILAGLASVIFGVLLMAQPAVGALTLIWLFAVYAIAFGVMLILLALKVRGGLRRLTKAL